MVNIGIVGLGFMAATHIRALRQVPSARLAALCNPSGKRLNGDFTGVAGNIGSSEAVKVDMSSVKAFTSYKQMLRDPEIDLVDICAPTLWHRDLAVQALKAGKHVLCEKPLARTSGQARAIVKAASRATKSFLMPAMCLRFWPEWKWLKQQIDAGQYGKVLSARFRRVAEPPGWGADHFLNGEKSGGALLDLHIHDTDFVQFCFGKPLGVFSTGYSKFSGAIDHVVTQYVVSSGAAVHAEGSWAMSRGFGFNMSYTVNFERATVDYDMARTNEALKIFVEGEQPRIIPISEPDGYVQEISYFVDCIQNSRAPTLVTVEDGLAAVEICEAEEHSIRTGKFRPCRRKGVLFQQG